MPKDSGQRASTEQTYTITREQLPLCCPLPGMRVWDGHPRVYLPIEKAGVATCPYCGAHFVLSSEKSGEEQPHG